MASKRRSVRQAVTRKRSVYVDPDTDDDFEAASEAEEERPVLTPTRSALKRRKKTAGPKPATRSRSKRQRPLALGQPRKTNNTHLQSAPKKEFSGPSDHRVPPWSSLPVDILRDIFAFGSQLLLEQSDGVSNVAWLLKASRTCRAFALPALEAFYKSPAIHAPLHLHHFLDLLQTPVPERYINYNVKVKRLSIPVRDLAYVAHNKGVFDISAIIRQLPQLQHMEITHPKYLPPYRSLEFQKWTFSPDSLFRTMNERDIKLKSWRWSRDTLPKNVSGGLYTMMMATHDTKLFEYLERLTICGFNCEDSAEPKPNPNVDVDAGEHITPLPGLAEAIGKLPALKDLTFICCDLIMDDFLLRLPRALERLELTNCLEITSDMLQKFFSSSGSHLRELVLNHNPALSLSFLESLEVFCPRLEVLKMDLHYYSEKFNTNDAAALYDELLSTDEVPTWPSTLRHLELFHAQKWSADAAQNFFRSLVDGADRLPALRTLILHAHMNIPWRDRVDFRDQWIERLRRVFLRPATDPFAYLGSFRQYRLWKQTTGMDKKLPAGSSADVSIRRELSHVQISPRLLPKESDLYSESDHAGASSSRRPQRRSTRVAESSQASQSATPDIESESADDAGPGDWRDRAEKFVQGLCDVVDVRIDNQRPRENQFTEGDFLDSERSGDEDWREGADEDADDDGYAW